MPRLSIVIPCPGGAADFDGTLVSVLQNRPASCEVLVAHSEPYDDPYALSDEVRFIHAEGRSLSALLNAALDQASGEVLHIIGCGLETTESWTESALAHFDDPDVAAVSPLIVEPNRQTIIAAGVRWTLGGARHVVNDRRVASPGSGRLRSTIVGPTIAAAFYRRDVLAAIGGFDVSLAEPLADVSVALALQSLGKLHVCEPGSMLIESSAASPTFAGGFHYGHDAERLYWFYAHERGLALSLVIHAWTAALDAARSGISTSLLMTLLGRATACMKIGSVRRHQTRLAAAADRLTELAKLRSAVRFTGKPRVTSSATESRRRAA